MKKVLFLLFTVAFGSLHSKAQDQDRLVISAGQLENISLGENMKVVLVSAETMQSEVKGDMKVFERLNVSISGSSMRIHSTRPLASRETVFVVVDELKSISLGQNTQVATQGILRGKTIKVFVEEGSRAHIKTTGEVKAFPVDAMEVSVQKIGLQPRAFAKGF